MPKHLLALAGTLGILVGITHPAFADAIDGDWCQLDGKHMTIRGPAIVTPGGQQTSGNYTRHFFSYVIPSGETGEGAAVEIQLRNENLAHERRAGDTTVHEWLRCKPGIS